MIDLRIEERLFESKEISFGVPMDDPRSAELKSDAPIVYDGERYHIYNLRTVLRKDGVRLRFAKAEINWMKLTDIKRPGDTLLEHLTPQEGLEAILTGTGWSVGNIDSSLTGNFFLTATDATVLQLVWAWCRVTGAEPLFESLTKTIHLVPQVGIDTTISFRYGRDLEELEKEETPPTATRLYGYGADDLDLSGVAGTPYVEDYTWYTAQGMTEDYARSEFQKDDVFSDSSIVDEDVLLAKVNAALAITSKPVIIYKAKVIDISRIAGVNANFKAGDYAHVHDDDLSQELVARVTRKVTYPQDESRNEVELSFNAVPLPDNTSTSTRTDRGESWVAFTAPITADFYIRNDGSYTVARLPLRFSTGGKYHLHLDLVGIGVGAGTVIVTIYDDETDTTIQTLETTYADGEEWRVFKTWFSGELEGRINYRLRVTTLADGGPSPSNGVNLTKETEARVSWYVLAQKATRQTPTVANSVTFDYTGAVQKWTVPDNLEGPIRISVTGAAGAYSSSQTSLRGKGTRVIGELASVIPGNVYDIYVGGRANKTGTTSGGPDTTPGWPNGGAGGARGSAGSNGGAGGGASYMVMEGGAIGDALIVAPGGGGAAGGNAGGDSGFFLGEDGVSGNAGGGTGATQFTFGLGGAGSGGGSGTDGAYNQGGDGGAGGGLLGDGGAGGGGGIYGGGGGGGTGAIQGAGEGGGGGGTGMVDPLIYNLEIQDGVNSGIDGQIIISWDDPVV